ncbi:MAG: PilZ domain-containing protein [Candidatus Sumerlaeia bacterium]|nr:PilZ domain-containing protein [Candidatus Sumerlaeia bacterium]
MIDQSWTPQNAEDTGGERRRAYRHPFSSACNLSILSPAWAITNQPYRGNSENITMHGLRVVAVAIDSGIARSLEATVQEDIDVKVEITFEAIPDMPPIKGAIVWFDRRNEVEGTVSLGILFDVPNETERAMLERLILSLQKS